MARRPITVDSPSAKLCKIASAGVFGSEAHCRLIDGVAPYVMTSDNSRRSSI
jgi:hypothetical protein